MLASSMVGGTAMQESSRGEFRPRKLVPLANVPRRSSVLAAVEPGSYEEYHPYGSPAWWAQDATAEVSLKRYRYTGMERDEETGLQAHGVRMYAPWLGRWTSADPTGLGD